MLHGGVLLLYSLYCKEACLRTQSDQYMCLYVIMLNDTMLYMSFCCYVN